MGKYKFKAESQRVLDLMIHSIYTNREIFIRELISNASDATDKLYYRLATEGRTGVSRSDFAIELASDEKSRTFTVSDNGIGMTEEELKNNLGVIAKSGSLEFKQALEAGNSDVDIIGQFGVGFYSAFMVAKRVSVLSRAYGEEKAHLWISNGVDGFTLEEAERDSTGTTITLTLKDDTEEESYSEFLDPYTIRSLVRKYSDYIRYPIVMEVTHSHLKEGTENEYETHTERETLNSMVPIWRKNKSEVTEEEYDEFYKQKFFDFEKPLRVIHMKTEGSATFSALLYLPSKAPYGYYTREYEKGLQLYSSGVMITERCAELLPDYFSFVKGLVDSEDLSLNISRETLQHDRQLKLIAGTIEKKIRRELEEMMKNDRESYEKFWAAFGLQLKYGVYADYGLHKDELSDLLLFRSARENKLISLREYADAMPADQKYIYFACGADAARAAALPRAKVVLDHGFDLLLLTDDVDEFAVKMLMKYADKEFRSATGDDLGLESDEEKQQADELKKQSEPLLTALKEQLNGKVSEVVLNPSLGEYPVSLTTKGAISLEMERVLSAMPGGAEARAQRVLEINSEHPVFRKLTALQQSGDTEELGRYARLLYAQSCILEGLPVDDPAEFSKLVGELMAR